MVREVARWSVLSCFIALPLVILGCNQERNESIRLMNKGLQLIKREKLTEGLALLGNAADVDPTNDRAFYYQGLVFEQKLANFQKAEAAYRRAIEISGDNVDYHYHLGSVLSQSNRPQPAIDELDKALKLKPDHAEAHLRLGISLEQVEKFDRAQEAYQQAIRHNPRLPEAYNALGNLYLRFEQYAHAAHVFRNAIENNPSFALNYHDLGLVYQAQERYPDAIAQFEKALQLNPAHAGTLFNLGMTYFASGDLKAAQRFLQQYLARRSAAEDMLRVETAQSTLARIDDAERRKQQ